MKKLLIIMVLLVSSISFAREARDVSIADRVALRKEVKEQVNLNTVNPVKAHCKHHESENKGC